MHSKPKTGIKLFDGRATTRETFYKRGLEAIMQATEPDDPAYLIAEAVLDAAGLSVANPQEAERKFHRATVDGADEYEDEAEEPKDDNEGMAMA